ncbi:MAG: twin-arginine translocase subunit TatB [Gammaproteobacteria bacterium]|nr:Sec-independent protein translocase protein TatB [Gammaproteobacteria bacterium]MYH34672.1 twin-arginine translocase subunit TatB [Gammaproteobacteria bacterium]MYL01877.1 twin-arginine translocase subunit TatB [Gammaproteobacteria bacterium]
MFDIGFLELIVLAGLGLIVLGPKRLPEVAAQLGRWVGQARRMSRTLMYQLRQEVNLDDPRPFSTRRPAQPAGSRTNTMHQQAGEEEKDPGSGDEEPAGSAENVKDQSSE